MSIKLFIEAGFLSVISLLGTVAHAEPLITVKADAITYLYGTKASKIDGETEKKNGNFFKMTGPTKMEWSVTVSVSGLHQVNLTSVVRKNYFWDWPATYSMAACARSPDLVSPDLDANESI